MFVAISSNQVRFPFHCLCFFCFFFLLTFFFFFFFTSFMHVLSLAGCLYLECHDLLFNLGVENPKNVFKEESKCYFDDVNPSDHDHERNRYGRVKRCLHNFRDNPNLSLFCDDCEGFLGKVDQTLNCPPAHPLTPS